MKFLVTMTALAAASFATVASAQSPGPYGSPALNDRARVLPVSDIAGPALPPYEVVTIIRSMGFDPASRPVLRGPVWVVRAFDDQDVLVRVAVDARTGRVVNVAEARRVAAYGEPPVERYGAYPVPPAPIPHGGTVYEETDVTTVGPRADAYPEETYDERAYPAGPRRSAGYPSSAYRPAPYTPSPRSTTRRAPHPKITARAPAQTKPAAPKVKSQAVKPVPQAAAPAATPQAKPPAVAAQQDTTGGTAKDTSQHHGISIPAPVASRKAAPEHSDTAPNPPAAEKNADDLKLVPVAPLE